MTEILTALALVMVIEGILPTLSPHTFKQAMGQILQMPVAHLRRYGLALMTAGALLLYLVRHSG